MKPDETAAPLVQVCPSCMKENATDAHLCRHCMTPLSAHASIDPMMSIGARADTLGKAATMPRKPIVLVGVWLLMGPIAGATLLGFGGMAVEMVSRPSVGLILGMGMMGVMALISGGLLAKTTWNYVNKPREPEGFPLQEENEEERAFMEEAESAGEEGEPGDVMENEEATGEARSPRVGP